MAFLCRFCAYENILNIDRTEQVTACFTEKQMKSE